MPPREFMQASRYKGRASLKVIERKFPHHVDMMVPEGGFGSRLNAMHARLDFHGIEACAARTAARTDATVFAGALLTL
jgi:hypothetical protein